ncbi:MAG TPA: hypothetical protein ENI60_03090 [Candidatus Fraserbacteria bacterium]|nr:hypothetical protein [Candidatus Fraserbacteria bacterium]
MQTAWQTSKVKYLIVSLFLIILLAAWPSLQVGIGQEKSEKPLIGPGLQQINLPLIDIQSQIELLTLIDSMGLSVEQMTRIHDLTSGLLKDQQEVSQTQFNLRDFLLEFAGDAVQFQQQVVPYREKFQTACAGYRTKLTSALEQVKGMLSLDQGTRLLDFVFGESNGILASPFGSREGPLAACRQRQIAHSDEQGTAAMGQPNSKGPAPSANGQEVSSPMPMTTILGLRIQQFLLANLEPINGLLEMKLKRLAGGTTPPTK